MKQKNVTFKGNTMKFLKKINPDTARIMTLMVVMTLITMPSANAAMTDFMQENTGIMSIGFGIIALFCLNEILGPFLKGGEIQQPLLKIFGAVAGIGIAISPDTLVSAMKDWGL